MEIEREYGKEVGKEMKDKEGWRNQNWYNWWNSRYCRENFFKKNTSKRKKFYLYFEHWFQNKETEKKSMDLSIKKS